MFSHDIIFLPERSFELRYRNISRVINSIIYNNFYSLPLGDEFGKTSCSLNDTIPDGFYWAQMNEKFFKDTSMCGVCYEIVSEWASIKVQIQDPTRNPHPYDFIHMEVPQQSVLPMLHNSSFYGLNQISYRMVSCEVKGGIIAYLAEGSSKYYASFLIKNYKIGLRAVSLITKEGIETVLSRTNYNHWVYKPSNHLEAPFKLKVTSFAGQDVTIDINDITPKKEYKTDKQFDVPKDKFFDPKTLKVVERPKSVQECCSFQKFDDAYVNGFTAEFMRKQTCG